TDDDYVVHVATVPSAVAPGQTLKSRALDKLIRRYCLFEGAQHIIGFQTRPCQRAGTVEKLYRRSHFTIISLPASVRIRFFAIERLERGPEISTHNLRAHDGFSPRVIGIIDSIKPS